MKPTPNNAASSTLPTGKASAKDALPVSSTKTPEEVYKAYLSRHEFVSGGFMPPNWTSDGAGFWFVDGAPEDTVILQVDLNTGKTVPMFYVTAVRTALAAATGHEPPYRGLPFDSFTPTRDGRAAFTYEGAQWRLNPSTSTIERAGDVDSFARALGWMSEDGSTAKTWKRYDYLSVIMDVPEQLSPCGEWFASVRDNNIMLRATSARNGREQQLTLNGTPDCLWDIEGLRFNISSGRRVTFRGVTPWSPDSLTLLAYRRNLTGVFRIPRLNWLKPFEDVEYFPCERAGAKLDRIEAVFVDVRSGRQIPVALGDTEDRYIQLLGWHPKGSEALIIVYTRDFKRLDIVMANRDTGAVRSLLTESAATFVKIQHDAMFSGEHGFRLLPDGGGFLWLSTRDGWNHLYRYAIDGQCVGRLTSGDWPVHAITHIGVDGFIYFTASTDLARPYDVHVCRVPLQGGKVEQLTRETGVHSPTFAPSGQAFLDTHSTVDRPTRTDLVRADGTQIRVVSQMDISRLEDVGYTPAEEFTVKAADDTTDLWGVMYKPFNFDPSQSYPVVEYIYAGPQTVEAPRFFAIDKLMMTTMKLPWALAQLGYIVVCLDARGTPGRSKVFHDVVYGNWTAGIPDHAAAIRQLCQRHAWMDANRVGITGHSWGGYFSTCALMHAPETYHAAVSYSPWYDPWSANIYEPYLDLPVRNRAAYDDADLTKQASKVKGRLMILAGTSDDIGTISAMKMTWALIEAGIDHEFIVVPQAFHEFAGVEEDYLLMKLTGWFDRHVKRRVTTR
jgi:dipeptidyl-peptidase-4